jgi:hypothetical protein
LIHRVIELQPVQELVVSLLRFLVDKLVRGVLFGALNALQVLDISLLQLVLAFILFFINHNVL